MPPTADTLASVRHLLGQAPDAEIAAQAGVTVDAVKARRRELGIAPFLRPPPGAVPAPVPPSTSSTASPAASGGVVLRRKAGDTAGGARRVLEHPLERHAHLFHQGLSDAEIADSADQPVATVRAYRAAHALPAAPAPKVVEEERPRTRVSPLEAFVDQLGKVPDAEIAARAGVSRTWVVSFRKRKGIAPLESAPASDNSPAAKSPTGPRRRRSKMDAVIHLIGVRPDAEVAQLAGVTADNVRNFRHRHGIGASARGEPEVSKSAPALDATPTPLVAAEPPPPSIAAPASRRKPGRKTPIDAFEHLLGTVPDAEVARLAGASVAAVSAYRARRRIPPFRDVAPRVESAPVQPVIAPTPSAPVAPEPVAAPPTPVAIEPVEASHAASAFKVLATNDSERRVFLVVAADVVEAATVAVRGLAAREDGPWQVRRIRLLGEGLR